MGERLSTGDPGLDEVLAGGLPANSISLVIGLPGSGKTLLAQQCAFANGTEERPAVYLSTVSEPFEKIVRYGQSLDFFDADAVDRRVFYVDAGATLITDGLSGMLDRIRAVLDELDPGLLVIDSFKPFAVFADSRSEYRRFLHVLAARLTIRPLATLWLGEYAVGDMASAPEFAVADAVLWLTAHRHDHGEIRLLQVLKLRGTRSLSGQHAYRLSSEGVRVFPRLADPGDQREYEPREGWISSGATALDEVLGQGYRVGSSTLVIGPSGAGKTVLGLQFAIAGSRGGDGAVFASFDENRSQLAGTVAGFGWPSGVRGLHLMYRSPVDLGLDEWAFELVNLIESLEVSLVVVDGLGHLQAAAHEPARLRECLYSLVQRCARCDVSLMMSFGSPELFGITRLGDVPLSYLADNVILLQFLRRDGQYRRALTVLKSRRASIEPRLTEYTIGSQGIQLSQPAGGQHAR